jgi:hypothetical protein
MKKSTVWIVLGMSAFAIAQQRLVFKDRKKDPNIRIEGNKGMVVPDKNFEISGNVVVENYAQKLIMTCNQAVGDLIKIKNKSDFDNVVLTGAVVVKQADNEQTTLLKCAKANYNLQGNQMVKLVLTRDVYISFYSSDTAKSDAVVTGSSAVAIIDRSEDAGEDKVQSLELQGPVLYKGKQFVQDGTGKGIVRNFTVKADRLTFTKARLIGNLEIQQTDDGIDTAEVTGAQVAILEFDNKNVVTRIRFSSEGQGQIRTVLKKRGGGL